MKYDNLMEISRGFLLFSLIFFIGAKDSDIDKEILDDYDTYIPPTSSVVCESLKKRSSFPNKPKAKNRFSIN